MIDNLSALREGRSEHVARFVGAMIDTQKAWTNTSMLYRVTREKVAHLRELFTSFDPGQISEYLIEMASGTWTQQVAVLGWDSNRLEKLSAIVIKQLVLNGCIRGASNSLLTEGERLVVLVGATLDWIEGVKVEGELLRISELIGPHPELRTMLVAPYAPGLAISTVLLRAAHAGYPFPDATNSNNARGD